MLSTTEFFEHFEAAGFTKLAAWTPSTGGDAQTAQVRYRGPTHDALGGAVQSDEHSIEYPSTIFPGLARAEIVILTLDEGDVSFQVNQQPRKQLDGTRMVASLSKVRA